MTRDPQRLWARPRQGGCRYMLLGPELSGQRCICVEYTRNKAAPASFCYCGHQADDHDIRKEENDIEEEGIGLKEPPKQETDEAKHDLTTGFGELEEHVSKCKAETELGVNATCQSIDRAGDYYAMYDLAGFDLGGDYGGISGLQWSEGPSSLPPQPINPDAITCLISIANKAMSSNTRPSCPPTALLANSHGHRKPKWPELEVELAKWYVSLHSPPKGPVVKAKAKELWQKLAPKHFAGQKQPGFRRGWRNLFKERNGLNLVKAPAEEGPTEFQPLFATDHEVPESSKSGEIDNSTHKDKCSDIGGASIKILKTDFADQITSPESADLLALYAEPNLGEELDWNVPQRSMYYSNHNSLQYPSTHSTFYPIPLQTEMTQKPILLNYSSQYKMDEIPKRLSADNHFISNPLYSTSIHSSDDPKGSRRHSDTAHAPNGQFKCPRPTCKHHTDGGFRRKGNLIRHIRRFHEAYGSEEPFETNRANDPTEKPLESNQMEASCSSDQTLTTPETVTASDDSVEIGSATEVSDMETDWEEEERGRYGLYLEICESNQRKHLWNAQVKQKRTKRLLNEPQEQRLIDCLMIRFYANFKGGTDYRSCAGNHNPSSQGILQFASSPNDRSSTHGNRTKRIFKPGEEENGDEEDGRPLKRPKRPTKPCEDRILGLKFACPYHQHNPRKYGVSLESSDADYRSCAGPGWRSVARIKEHLYRRHRIPIKCSRCSKIFKHQDHLNSHLRNGVPCEVRPEEPIEGVTADIEKKLKSRKKAWPNQTEVDRWREVYQILFPNEDIPSPYYEHEDEVAIFEDYSSRETPRVFLELLESRASTNRLTEETKDELVDMIRECRRFVYRQFRQRETQNTPPPPISVAGFNNTNPILRSNISQDTSVNSIETTTFQTGILRCTDFDPDEFQSIFLDQSTLDWDPFEINNISKSQKQCYCIAPCSCPSSASLKFTAVMDELPRGADLGEEMKRLKQENEELRSLIQAQSSFDL